MWSNLRALAALIGLTAEETAAVEREGGASLVNDPLNNEVHYRVRPDPDWTQRIEEAWDGTLVNSRRESAGTIQLHEGLLQIADGMSPEQGITAQVIAGQYEVILTIAHLGAEETYDYEEHVSHAFILLKDKRHVAEIEPLTDEHGVELGVEAYTVAFSANGALQQLAGNHAGRWTLKVSDLFHPKSSKTNPSDRKSVRIANDDGSGAAILVRAGHGRDDYSIFRLVDMDGNTVGVLLDFFVDNRPW